MIIYQSTLNCQAHGRGKNYGFEFLKSIDFFAKEEVMQSIRQATCHTLIIGESKNISSNKMLIMYIKHCTADACRLMTKTVFAGIIPLARCDSHSILEEIKKLYTTNNIDIPKNGYVYKWIGLLSCLINEIV